ncbi:MAG: methyltransferase domain-containing protein [Candidatus Bathyarchaeota archaeon]|jgi:SAM-dependent methyltransferase
MDVKKERFVAYEAYERLADAYAERVDYKPHNAYLEMPSTLSLIPDIMGKRVLDAGCGTGRYTRWLLEGGADVIGIDASPKMLRHAKKKIGNRADLRLHDLNKPLNFLVDSSVDLILAALVLDYLRDWDPVLREFHRVLKDDGYLIISMGHPALDFIKDLGMEDYWIVERVENWWKGFGDAVLVPSYRRPLQAATEALHRAGFLIERLIEARPTEEYREADPEGYEEVRWRPSFLCIRAVPRRLLHL